jgi:hypothetical protein
VAIKNNAEKLYFLFFNKFIGKKYEAIGETFACRRESIVVDPDPVGSEKSFQIRTATDPK